MQSFFNAVRRWLFRKPPSEKEVPPPWHFTFLDDPDPPNVWNFRPIADLPQTYTLAEVYAGQSLETVLRVH